MKITNLKLLSVLFLASMVFFACKDEDDPMPPTTEEPTASFQFSISESNFLEVTFSNFSQRASSYSWDFGDGTSSTEENPVHTYKEAGEYKVVLTASSSDSKTHSNTKTVSITNPDSAIKDLTGDDQKVWKLSRNVADEEYPLIVGPDSRSEIWWAYGLSDPIGARPCLMEEEYIFKADKTFTYNSKGVVFAEYDVWSGDVQGNCVDETDATQMLGANGDDLSAWGSGDHVFEFDAAAATLTLRGLGAHIGLPKVATNSEVKTPQEQITYKVISITTDGPVDKMQLETTIDGGYWQFNLVSYDNPADEPELPGAAPTTSFNNTTDGNTVTFNNTTINGESYMWDFGDGNTSTEENPTHTYANDGSYTVVLMATNENGTSEVKTNIIISTNAMFSAEIFHGEESKTWKLNPVAAALAVGPGIGSAEWWASSEEDIVARACTFDDTYTFTKEGEFTYETNGNVWAEDYMGVMEAGCISVTELSADASPWASGTHSFTVTEATDTEPAYITVKGTGAFIALPKAYNGGEYTSPTPAAEGSVTYQVLSYINDGSSEVLVITVDISEGEMKGAYWTFSLIAE